MLSGTDAPVRMAVYEKEYSITNNLKFFPILQIVSLFNYLLGIV